MRKKRKKVVAEEQSLIGRIIDLPLEEFKKEIVEQKVPIGVINNIKLNFVGAYEEFRIRKDGIVSQILEGKLDKEDPLVKKTLDGIYAEMTKIEQKALYLTERIKELDVDKEVFDTKNN